MKHGGEGTHPCPLPLKCYRAVIAQAKEEDCLFIFTISNITTTRILILTIKISTTKATNYRSSRLLFRGEIPILSNSRDEDLVPSPSSVLNGRAATGATCCYPTIIGKTVIHRPRETAKILNTFLVCTIQGLGKCTVGSLKLVGIRSILPTRNHSPLPWLLLLPHRSRVSLPFSQIRGKHKECWLW